jgi:hypothetical protein
MFNFLSELLMGFFFHKIRNIKIFFEYIYTYTHNLTYSFCAVLKKNKVAEFETFWGLFGWKLFRFHLNHHHNLRKKYGIKVGSQQVK